jgi:hypothetical protein
MLFNRFIEVDFPDAGQIIGGRQELVGGAVNIPPAISFDVKHSSEASPNEARITIYNMHADTQAKVLQEGKRIELHAGYWPANGERYVGIIFKGQIRKTTTWVEGGTEVVTAIECGDGDDGFAHSRVRKRTKGRQTHRQTGDDIVAAFHQHGITPGRIEIPDYTEKRPRTIDRAARNELNDIARQHDLRWSIQDGVLNVTSRDHALNDRPVILSPDTGLLDSPKRSEHGVDVKTLMLPDLRPGQTFRLENPYVANPLSGEEYMILEITFAGDNFGGDFGCQIEARGLHDPAQTDKPKKRRVRRSRERINRTGT